jgi:hypothetical protein
LPPGFALVVTGAAATSGASSGPPLWPITGVTPCDELGLTRFGGHPEAFSRGALYVQNPTTLFA